MATATFYMLRLKESLEDATLSVTIIPKDADPETAERHASTPLHGNIKRVARDYVYRIDTWERAVGEFVVRLDANSPGHEVLVRLPAPANAYVSQDVYWNVVAASPLVASVRYDKHILSGFAVTLAPAALADTKAAYQALADLYANLVRE
jgi:hypothetical protein